ncbi:MAG: hypothetical protein M0037_15810 [Betaproteobacteria bacterium]|jgi:hypothetical protein|nr:hypothetical protein [Betaproteobacteria bacterium]
MSANEIAAWMFSQLGTSWLRQQSVARMIRTQWGEEHVYKNKNRHWAINPDILEEFRKLTEEQVVWSRSRQAWRERRNGDGPGRMVK